MALRSSVRRGAGAVRGNAPIAATHVRPYEDIPGPKPLPLVGNVWRFIPGIGTWGNMDILEIHRTLRDTLGDIVKLAGLPNNRDMVALYNPKDIEKVFRTEGPWPKRDAFGSLNYYRRFTNPEKYDGAQGLVATNGEEWQQFRRSVQAPMLQPLVVAKYTAPIDDVAAEFIERLRELRDENGVLPEDTDNWFFRWALESIATIALDTRLGCLRADAAGEPQRMIDAVQVLFEGLFQLDLMFSPWKYVSTPMWRRYVRAIRVIESVSEKYTKQTVQRLQAKVARGQALGDDLSVAERLLLANDNPRIAVTMAQDMLVGGIDTTSYATATLLYFLSRNPEKQEALHDELRRVLPQRDTPVTHERLQDMKYLRAAIKESMRMKPVAIGVMRENQNEEFHVAGYNIRKGADLLLMTAVAGNDPRFVPQAERFLPERWLKGEGEGEGGARGHPFAVLPFGFGPRVCVGKRFAELEIEVLNAKLLRNFRVEYPREGEFQIRLLQVLKSPLTFRLVDRD